MLVRLANYLRLLLLIYAAIYMFPMPWNMLPIIGEAFSYYNLALDALVTWTGEHILQLGKVERIEVTGSGDTTFDYINVATTAMLALCTSAVIFALSKGDKRYTTLRLIVITYARYYVAIFMLSYGIAKLYALQFPFPSITRLDQSIGDASPMGLLWTFMGSSSSYSFFGGLCEIICGMLLFFRRTTALGALLCVGVMVNVAMLNCAYDVPVKIFSTHLVFICMLILSPYMSALAQFFFGGKSVALSEKPLPLCRPVLNRARIVTKALIILGFPVMFVWDDMTFLEERSQTNPFNGIYNPITFSHTTDTLEGFTPDSLRWRKMLIDNGSMTIEYMNAQKQQYAIIIDTSQHTLQLTSTIDSTLVNSFYYELTSDSTMSISGSINQNSINASFRIKRPADYLLVKRGFHWVSEYPYNR